METLSVILVIWSVFWILYVLAGYPLLLAFLAKRKARPVRKQLELKTVSIILPVRNGQNWIISKLDSISKLNYPRELIEILVVSDGSDDQTDKLVQNYPDNRIHLLRISKSGKASALNAGMRKATGEILFFTDVRQQLDPDSLRNLVACLGDPEVGVAGGELIIRDGVTHQETGVGLYWRYEKWIRTQLSRLDSTPGVSGCIYAMRSSLAVPLPEDTLLDDVYQPMAAFFKGYRVILDGTARAYDYPTKLNDEFRRKVRTLAGVYQVIAAFPALLGPANRMWLHFISHKLGRLLLPYALVLMAIASFGLPEICAGLALTIQTMFYGLALMDVWMPEHWPLKRLCSLPRVFVVLMAAAVGALSIFFLPKRVLWKDTRVSSAYRAT